MWNWKKNVCLCVETRYLGPVWLYSCSCAYTFTSTLVYCSAWIYMMINLLVIEQNGQKAALWYLILFILFKQARRACTVDSMLTTRPTCSLTRAFQKKAFVAMLKVPFSRSICPRRVPVEIWIKNQKNPHSIKSVSSLNFSINVHDYTSFLLILHHFPLSRFVLFLFHTAVSLYV